MPTSPNGIFGIFLRLGCTSFGGPIAHLGYLRAEFVARRKWLDDEIFADLVAILPTRPSEMGQAMGNESPAGRAREQRA